MLEDFFTLSELKDGISSVARIEELVSIIKSLESSAHDTLSDSIRQWLAVARILAATESAECLQHFVQLNGLCFLSQWLQKAQSCQEDVRSSINEQLIDVILVSLSRLPVDSKQSTSSGIKDTVKQLLSHGNGKIHQNAVMLCEKWAGTKTNGLSCQQVGKDRPPGFDHSSPCTSQETESGRQGESREEGCTKTKSDSDIVHVASQLAQMVSNSQDGKAIVGDMDSGVSPLPHGSLKNLSAKHETSWSTTGMAHSKFDDVKRDDQHAVETAFAGVGKVGEKSCTDSEPTTNDHSASRNLEAQNSQPIASDDPQHEMDSGTGGGKPESLQDQGANSLPHVAHCSEDKSKQASILGEEGSRAIPQMRSTLGGSNVNDIGRERRSKRTEGIGGVSHGDSSKTTQTMLTRGKSNLFMEDDETDALEVARQVAIEVEREVIDYREGFCSSPEVHSGDSLDVASPDLDAPQQSQPAIEDVGNGSPDTSGHSDSSSSVKEDGSGITDDSGSFSRKHDRNANLASSAQELDSKSSRSPCELDLNANYCSREADCFVKPDPANSINLSTPIPVAASRGASMFPITPLHFEGELGWKGSAATSAFRPASPRWTPDREKALPGTKQKASCVGFDLNIAESGDTALAEPQSTEMLQMSSRLPSSTSTASVGLRKADRLDLDLNCPCDDGFTSNAAMFWNRQSLNVGQSEPSTSSSSRQPVLRNFDLNDSSSFQDGSGSQAKDESSLRISGANKAALLEQPAITIMGSRISLGRKDQHNQIHHSFMGTAPSAEGSVIARSFPPPYSQMPPSPYGVISYPSTSPTMSFPPAFYGPQSVPYMVDYKGASTIPMMGLGHNGALPSLSRAAHAPAPQEYGYCQPSLDMNYGMLSLDMGHRESGFVRPMFLQGHTVLIDEHRRVIPQGSNPGFLLKRKEPDSCWEPYPHG